MTLKEILLGGGGTLFVLLTLIQLAPIKINPWSAMAKAFGRAINSEVLEKVGRLESELQGFRPHGSRRTNISPLPVAPHTT